MKSIVQFVESMWGFIRRLGPYLILEMVLPGGTLVALLLFFYRSHRQAEIELRQGLGPALVAAGTGPKLVGAGKRLYIK
jgi:hypothetical protein